MPEHSKVAGVVQFAAEQVEGVAQFTTKQMATLNIDFSPDGTFTDFSPSGNKFNTITIQGKEFVKGVGKGPATFEELLYIFSSYANYVAPTQLTGAGVTAWAPSTAYSTGAFVSPFPMNGLVYKCTTAGTSGSLPPAWPTSAAGTVVDGGTLVWTCMKWKATTVYAANDILVPTAAVAPPQFGSPTEAVAITPTQYYFKATTGGTSGATEPTWASTGTVPDGSVVWTPQGVYFLAYQYTFAPQPTTSDVSKTFTFEWGEPSTAIAAMAYRALGCFYNDFGLMIDRDKLDITTNLLGRREQPGISITPYGNVSSVPLKPLIPGRTGVFYSLVSLVDLANETNRMTRAFVADVKLPPKYATHWPLDETQPSFGARTELEQKPTLTLTVGADAVTPVANAWNPGTTYTANTFVYGTGTAAGLVFQCTTGGTSASFPPTWNQTAGGTTTDGGTLVWTCRKWQASTAYTASSPVQFVVPTVPNGFVYKCTTPGTSAVAEPGWTFANGTTVTDGTVVWTAVSVDFTDPFTVDRMRRGTMIWVRIKNTTTDFIGLTNIPYTFIIDMALRVNKAFAQKDVDNALLAIEWQLGLYSDGSAAGQKAYQIILKCATPYP